MVSGAADFANFGKWFLLKTCESLDFAVQAELNYFLGLGVQSLSEFQAENFNDLWKTWCQAAEMLLLNFKNLFALFVYMRHE